jgi:hypothetical protein
MDTVTLVAKDRRTRFEGVYVRHRKSCRADAGARCSCQPGYMARVWDRAHAEQLHSPTFRSAAAARAWRNDTLEKLARGELPEMRSDLRVAKAVERFVDAAREGKVLTKHGRRYKPTAVRDLESALGVHVVPELGGMRLTDVRRGDVQRLVDGLELSGSRVRTIVNALRSLYRWAQDRDLSGHDPAALVRLPAMDATPRDRVAAPAELEQLLGVLTAADAVPYALAAYATARRQEIRTARWRHVSFELAALELAVDEVRPRPRVASSLCCARCSPSCARSGCARGARGPTPSYARGAAAGCCPARRSPYARSTRGAGNATRRPRRGSQRLKRR